jgi:hypothetical protein
MAVVMFLLAVSAAPMSAAGSKIKLSDISVAPRTGTPKTTVVVSVVVSWDKGPDSRVDRVTATIGGKDYAMTRLPGGTPDKGGVKFRWSGTLAVGSYQIVITAKGNGSNRASVGAGSVTIKTPAATSTKPPAPKPPAKPAVGPTAVKKPAAVLVVAKPDPDHDAPEIAPTSTWRIPEPATAAFSAAAVAALLPQLADPGDGTDRLGGGPVGSGSTGSNVPVVPSDGRGGATSWGPLAGVFAAIGVRPPTLPPLGLAPTLVTTTGAVATAMAFGLFGRRRRDDGIDDDVLAAAAATGVGVGPDRLVGAGVPIGVVAGTGVGVAERALGEAAPPVDPGVDEALLPRWRRPSLLQARKADPIRDGVQTTPRLTFDQGLVGPLAGHERRVIRYRVVRLLDSPDELRGIEIGYLDEGDEVQLLEKYGAYWLVQAPDGQQGWLHKMVLAEIAEEEGPAPDVPVATMPTVADSWTMGESDVDSDVFEAYLEARRRAS